MLFVAVGGFGVVWCGAVQCATLMAGGLPSFLKPSPWMALCFFKPFFDDFLDTLELTRDSSRIMAKEEAFLGLGALTILGIMGSLLILAVTR